MTTAGLPRTTTKEVGASCFHITIIPDTPAIMPPATIPANEWDIAITAIPINIGKEYKISFRKLRRTVFREIEALT